MSFNRCIENPILLANKNNAWEATAAFNPSVIKVDDVFHMVYRALSIEKENQGVPMQVSSVAYAKSLDGVNFSDRRQLIEPKEPWERFGCEDPKITFFEGKYYIFYTALSNYPFSAPGIKVGLAISSDLNSIEKKYLVTPFNCKAMALFPQRINGKIVAILTVNTDMPPAKIALAFFDKEEDLWCQTYWYKWYYNLDSHVIPLLKHMDDHLEVGFPVKTDNGWLVIYSYIHNYFSSEKIFSIEAVLLDLENPCNVIGKANQSLLSPEEEYELHGEVVNVIFPSGGVIEKDELFLYYGATDTSVCLAKGNVNHLLESMLVKEDKNTFMGANELNKGFTRSVANPIISPRPEFEWEAQATFNPAAIYEDGKFHLIYRAVSRDDASVFGYASSKDGVHIDQRLNYPIYIPRANFEKNLRPGTSGCEDPRITKLGDKFYMFYTAYDGFMPRVAFSSIKVDDFLNHRWNWEYPKVITPASVEDKDACVFPRKINNKYVIFHRVNKAICINFEENLNFNESNWLIARNILIKPRSAHPENKKFGVSTPPIETKYGWLVFYHRIDISSNAYITEAMLLELNDPRKIIALTDISLLKPETDYEKIGLVSNVVFPCGAVLYNEDVYLYYGGADRVIGVAKMSLSALLKHLGI